MAMTIEEVERHLEAEGWKFKRIRDTAVGLVFGNARHYRDPEGSPEMLVVVSLEDEGTHLSIFAPNAFKARGPHVDAFLRACAMLQWTTKNVQFEYDARDGEIRPVVEFPLEDGKVTQKQLARCVRSIVNILDRSYPVLQQALETGKVEVPGPEQVFATLIRGLLEQLSPDALAKLLEEFKGRERSERDSKAGSTTDDQGSPEEL